MIGQVTSLLSNYFASPVGLVSALSLIPLFLFYFMKPEPEQKIMPSMAFFMENKESGKLKQALNTFMQNFLLLIHILILLGLAAAIANPLITGNSRPENSVLVIDTSSSMKDDFAEAKKFVRNNLGKDNTVIISGKRAEVKMTQAPPSRVRIFLKSLKAADVETDIVSGLKAAQGYEGKIAVASDLVQTSNSESARELVKSIRENRKINVYDSKQDNRWGIVDVEPGKTSKVELANFMNKSVEIKVNKPEGTETIGINARDTREISFESEEGRNIVSLPKDGIKSDNKAYLFIPSKDDLEVTLIADKENLYFKEAVKAIDFANYNFRSPPLKQDVKSDVYVVGDSERILKSTVQDLERKVGDGRSIVVFAQEGLEKKGFNSIPTGITGEKNRSVEITEPRRINIDQTVVKTIKNVNGSSWSSPKEAVVTRKYGSGRSMLYNIRDKDFRYNFFYPVFWKEVFKHLTEKKSIGDLNIETGEKVGKARVVKSGFHNISGHQYAANLESFDESATEPKKIDQKAKKGDNRGKKSAQHLAAIILTLISLAEIAYLIWIGEL